MRFFLYGTLTAASDNEVARRLHALLEPGTAATVRGYLYAIEDEQGWYPGLIPDAGGDLVHGFLHEAASRFGQGDLAIIDRYENFDPLKPDCSEFLRQEILVETASRGIAANAYVLRESPLKGFVTVAGGSFSGFIRQSGLRPFGSAAGVADRHWITPIAAAR